MCHHSAVKAELNDPIKTSILSHQPENARPDRSHCPLRQHRGRSTGFIVVLSGGGGNTHIMYSCCSASSHSSSRLSPRCSLLTSPLFSELLNVSMHAWLEFWILPHFSSSHLSLSWPWKWCNDCRFFLGYILLDFHAQFVIISLGHFASVALF